MYETWNIAKPSKWRTKGAFSSFWCSAYFSHSSYGQQQCKVQWKSSRWNKKKDCLEKGALRGPGCSRQLCRWIVFGRNEEKLWVTCDLIIERRHKKGQRILNYSWYKYIHIYIYMYMYIYIYNTYTYTYTYNIHIHVHIHIHIHIHR